MASPLPGLSGIEGVARLKQQHPRVLAMMLTVYDNNNVFEALAAGASGYLLKRDVPERLLDSLTDLLAGGSPMSGAIAQQRETCHDAGPNVINLNDSDNAQWPDDWEILNFGDTTSENKAGAPDLDLYNNLEESLANTNPRQFFSSPDGDADRLPDGWEVFWFRTSPSETLFDITTKFVGVVDPDGDFFSNRNEFTANTNPNLMA